MTWESYYWIIKPQPASSENIGMDAMTTVATVLHGEDKKYFVKENVYVEKRRLMQKLFHFDVNAFSRFIFINFMLYISKFFLIPVLPHEK